MSFSSEYTHSLSCELDKILKAKNPRVSKVEGGESWIALCIGAPWLLFSWGSRMNGICSATENEISILKKSAPARTPLVEFMRSHILRGQLIGASQLQSDRIIKIEAIRIVGAGFLKNHYIIFEATEPNGNLLLLDETHSIMELARHATPDENRYRTLLPGHVYIPPRPFEGTDLAEIETLDYDNVRTIKGISKQLAELIQNHWDEKSASDWLSILREIKGAQQKSSECYYQVNERGYLTLAPVIFDECVCLGKDALEASRFLISELLKSTRSRLLSYGFKIIDKTIRSKQRHKEGIEKQISRSDAAQDFKLCGQMILEHISEIPLRANKVVLASWNNDVKIEISLDPELTAAKNAERYFNKYRKAQANEKKLDYLYNEISSIDQLINELSEQKELLSLIDDVTELEYAVKDISDWLSQGKSVNNNDSKKSANRRLPAHLRYEIGGALILVGLNAHGNRFVTFKQAAQNDLWLHAHELPGAHVIVKGNITEEIIEYAASLAAHYSKGKNYLKVQVDCTQRKNVRSIPGSAIAHVTYSNPRTLFVSPLLKHNKLVGG